MPFDLWGRYIGLSGRFHFGSYQSYATVAIYPKGGIGASGGKVRPEDKDAVHSRADLRKHHSDILSQYLRTTGRNDHECRNHKGPKLVPSVGRVFLNRAPPSRAVTPAVRSYAVCKPS